MTELTIEEKHIIDGVINVTFGKESKRPTTMPDILDSPEQCKLRSCTLSTQRFQMHAGDFWEKLPVVWDSNFEKIDQYGGLDLINHKRKEIHEVKNRYNTTNADQRRAIFDKFVEASKEYKDYAYIFGAITGKDTDTLIEYKGIKIRLMIVNPYLKHIFGSKKQLIF